MTTGLNSARSKTPSRRASPHFKKNNANQASHVFYHVHLITYHNHLITDRQIGDYDRVDMV